MQFENIGSQYIAFIERRLYHKIFGFASESKLSLSLDRIIEDDERKYSKNPYLHLKSSLWHISEGQIGITNSPFLEAN